MPSLDQDRPATRRLSAALCCIAAASIVLLAIVQPARLIIQDATNLQEQTQRPDDFTLHIENYAKLRPALPNVPKIGYASALPVDVTRGGPGTAQYYLSQFALAPVLLDHQGSHPYIFANFDHPAQLNHFVQQSGYTTVAPIAPGKALIRTGPP